jgi:hypothetical protein
LIDPVEPHLIAALDAFGVNGQQDLDAVTGPLRYLRGWDARVEPQRDATVTQVVWPPRQRGGNLGWGQGKLAGVLPDVPVSRGVEHSPVLAPEEPAVSCVTVTGDVSAQHGD